MTLDLIHNAALVLALCWLQSLISRRWETGTLKAQVLSGVLFSVATVIVMMTAILLAPGLWLWTDSSMAVVGVSTLAYGPVAGGLAALSGIAYQWWIGGLSASGAVINLVVVYALGLLFRFLARRRDYQPDWKGFLAFGFVIYAFGSWQLFYFHLDNASALNLQHFLTILAIMAPVTALLGLQLQYIERKNRLEKQVHYLAHYDTLTGLPNRHKTIAELKSRTQDPQAATPFAVAIFYLQDFQLFNESLGADVGDHILNEISRRLEQLCGEGCFVSRLSGLEFLALKPLADDRADIEGFCSHLRDSLALPILYNDKKLKLDLAVGAARCPADAATGHEAMRKASLALQAAREDRLKPVVLFNDEMEKQIQESLALRKHLAQALDHGEIDVFYQPYYDIADDSIYGIEALVRWNHPTYGLRGPDFFLAAAEQSGLITSVGAWVIEHACLQARVLKDRGAAFSAISVNVSLVQLADYSFPEIIADILRKTGLDAHSLILEVAETAIARQSDMVFRSTRALGEMGVRFAIDNFGSDYTNISFMKKVGVDLIKVDRGYITKLKDSEESREMVQAFIRIANSLGITALAVGVEDETERDLCKTLGFDMAQGYFYSKPLAEAELASLGGDEP